MRADGSARLSLSYTASQQNGISRISCEVAAAELVQLVLFAEIIGLQAALNVPRQTELTLDGLVLQCGAIDRDVLSITRQTGLSSQTAYGSLNAFLKELEEVTDMCLGQAEAAAYGPILKDLLGSCRQPDDLLDQLSPDMAEIILHRLQEMAFLILTEETALKGSKLARKLRRKKGREDALPDVESVLASLAQEFTCDEEDLAPVSLCQHH
ncbi:hypothetical protein BV911_03575 [Pseudoruegeria sp. SK021]|nr:hypothetical protein BV911_03575 [Pseudoruegeria sp. SK021]